MSPARQNRAHAVRRRRPRQGRAAPARRPAAPAKARRGGGAGPSARRPTARSRACWRRARSARLVFWGPPGTGKTTVARLLAQATDLHFEQISAIFTGVADLKKVFEEARRRRETGQGTLLFVDEIHRFNRAQQDSFLPVMEDGTIILVGATTENPSFELNAPLLSRARVLVFKSLDARGDREAAGARRADRRRAAAARRGRARVAHRHGRRRRPRRADARRGSLARRAQGRDIRRRAIAGDRAAPRADLRQIAGRPLQSHLRAAQIGARLRSRRRALLSLPHARCRRAAALHRAPRGAHGDRGYRPRRSAGAGDRQRRQGRLRFSGLARKASWPSRRPCSMSPPRRNRTPATPPMAPPCAPPSRRARCCRPSTSSTRRPT